MKSGFSLIELIVSLAIILLLGTIGISSFVSFRRNQELTNTVDQVVSVISSARSKSLASEDYFQYGVHFSGSSVTLFQGTTFSDLDPNNVELLIISGIEISNISLSGGGVDLVFEKITAETDDHGTITLRSKLDITETKIIQIKSTGIVDVL